MGLSMCLRISTRMQCLGPAAGQEGRDPDRRPKRYIRHNTMLWTSSILCGVPERAQTAPEQPIGGLDHFGFFFTSKPRDWSL